LFQFESLGHSPIPNLFYHFILYIYIYVSIFIWRLEVGRLIRIINLIIDTNSLKVRYLECLYVLSKETYDLYIYIYIMFK